MKLSRTVPVALLALRRNLMRAFLTMLGIMIGIAAVIAMMEIGQGSSRAIQKTIASMGANTLLVLPGTAASGGVSFGAGSVLSMTPDDAAAILRDIPAVRATAPVVRARTQATYGNKNWVPLNIYGTTPSFLDVRDWRTLTEGEMFTGQEVRNAGKVCVIGHTVARELFGNESPVGKELRIKNVSFRVVGVLSRKGANMMGMDQDDIIIAPWTSIKLRVSGTSTTATQAVSESSESSSAMLRNRLYPAVEQSLYPEADPNRASDQPMPTRFSNIDQILVAARSSRHTAIATEQITMLLRERHRITPGEPDDFSIRNMSEVTNALSSTTKLMTNLLLGVALISLIVGGVGIMNIMLVSVTERTREIGLRMAVGARGKDILQQFLVEALVLCLAGGIIGILLGRGISLLVRLLLRWPTELSLLAIVAAVTVSLTVGVVFGFYPAWKASRMDPIQALHYE